MEVLYVATERKKEVVEGVGGVVPTIAIGTAEHRQTDVKADLSGEDFTGRDDEPKAARTRRSLLFRFRHSTFGFLWNGSG